MKTERQVKCCVGVSVPPRLCERYIQTTCMEKLTTAITPNLKEKSLKLVSSTLRTVVVKFLYSPTRFV